MAKVLSLFSGSLASRIATRLVARHPEVESVCLLYFRSPFAREPEDLRHLAREEWPGVPLRTQSLKREYRRMIDSAYGDAFSLDRSCLSCRRILAARAVRYMERTGSEYLVTGDVLGHRGVSGRVLCEISKASGLDGRILRPLCSKDPMAQPVDLRGWCEVPNRRAPTAGLSEAMRGWANDLGIEPRDPMASRNRCKLTFPGFGERVAHLFSEVGFTLNELRLLDFPLYYEVHPHAKVVVAIEEQEKRELQNLFLPQDLRVYTAAPHGPMTLVRTRWEKKNVREREDVIQLAARITATHIGCDAETPIPIYYRFENDNERLLVNVLPFSSCSAIAVVEGIEVVPLGSSPVLVG